MTAEQASERISEELGVSLVTMSVSLPYRNAVYNLENKSEYGFCKNMLLAKSAGIVTCIVTIFTVAMVKLSRCLVSDMLKHSSIANMRFTSASSGVKCGLYRQNLLNNNYARDRIKIIE